MTSEQAIEVGQIWYWIADGHILDILRVSDDRVGYGLVVNGDGAAGSCGKVMFRKLAAFAGYRERLGGLRELQAALPWNENAYSTDFFVDSRPHKLFEHALLHVVKAVGKLAAQVEEADHTNGPPMNDSAVPELLADVVICALRMANTRSAGAIDLQGAIEDRLREKNPGWAE